MVYDCDYRECPCAAVDTQYAITQQGADTPGAFVVPQASRLTGIRIFASGIVTDVVTGSTIQIHLEGLGGLQWYAGPLVSVAGAAATSGGFQFRDGMLYKTNIPVRPGQTINAYAYISGEDMGTAHVLVALEYDGTPGLITDADLREVDIGAAANTLVSAVYRGTATDEGDFKVDGRRIVEIIFGAALDPTGDAANGLVFAPALKLSGPGLVVAGNYCFLGPAGPTQPDTDVSGDQNCVALPSRYQVDIATRPNSTIRAQCQNIESINPSHAIVGLCYG